jgi:hypothetical protein
MALSYSKPHMHYIMVVVDLNTILTLFGQLLDMCIASPSHSSLSQLRGVWLESQKEEYTLAMS